MLVARIAATALVLVTLVACAVAAQASSTSDPRGLRMEPSGPLFAGSADGKAIVRAANLAPGARAHGEVSVENAGAAARRFSLRARVDDRPGPNGGVLSRRLEVVVREVSPAGGTSVVYAGKLAGLDERTLSPLAARESRSYRFELAFPDGGTPPSPTGGDNAYQGSAAGAELRWSAG